MTRAFDVRQLIAEQASDRAERRGLEELAEQLDETLSNEVPYRPEFKAQLRQRLMRQARRQLTPWYRRPAFAGSGMAVAAAAAVLIFGLKMWQADLPKKGLPQAPSTDIAQPAPAPTPPAAGFYRVNDQLRDVQVLHLPDEKVTGATPAVKPASNGEATPGILQLKTLTARPDEEQFRAMASRMSFRGESRRTANGWVLNDEKRTLTLTQDGQVGFTDTAPTGATAAGTLGDQEARQIAHRFLDQALLPIPAAQPVVNAEHGAFRVIYTDQVEGRPVVNAPTVIWVDQRGGVLKAEAYVSSGTTTQGSYQAISEAEAITEAKRQGGTFDRADLVWVRTPGERTVYLQPYWRVFGTDLRGDRMIRYVPALKR